MSLKIKEWKEKIEKSEENEWKEREEAKTVATDISDGLLDHKISCFFHKVEGAWRDFDGLHKACAKNNKI